MQQGLNEYINNQLIRKSGDGLGENVAESIVKARKENAFISKEDLMNRTQLSYTLLKKMDELNILKDLDEENQMTLF